MKIKQVNTVICYEFDNLVSATYGRPYCLQQQDGSKDRGIEYVTVPVVHPWDYENDTVPEIVNGPKYGVSFKAWLARDPQQKLSSGEGHPWELNLFWDRNFYPNLDMVVNDLHAKGLMPAGEYHIVIDW